jgi:hypothetical protein
MVNVPKGGILLVRIATDIGNDGARIAPDFDSLAALRWSGLCAVWDPTIGPRKCRMVGLSGPHS